MDDASSSSERMSFVMTNFSSAYSRRRVLGLVMGVSMIVTSTSGTIHTSGPVVTALGGGPSMATTPRTQNRIHRQSLFHRMLFGGTISDVVEDSDGQLHDAGEDRYNLSDGRQHQKEPEAITTSPERPSSKTDVTDGDKKEDTSSGVVVSSRKDDDDGRGSNGNDNGSQAPPTPPAPSPAPKEGASPATKKDAPPTNKEDSPPTNKKDASPATKKDTPPTNKKDASPADPSDKKDAAPSDKKDATPGKKKDGTASSKKDAAPSDKKGGASSPADKKDAAPVAPVVNKEDAPPSSKNDEPSTDKKPEDKKDVGGDDLVARSSTEEPESIVQQPSGNAASKSDENDEEKGGGGSEEEESDAKDDTEDTDNAGKGESKDVPSGTTAPSESPSVLAKLDCKSSTCESCIDEYVAASAKPEEPNTCIWKISEGTAKCVMVTKAEAPDKMNDEMCSEKTPPSDPPAGKIDEETGGGSGTGFVVFLLLLGVGGGAYYVKEKLQLQLPMAPPFQGGFVGASTGLGGGARSTKYEQVASDDDEEWGWGDEDGNDEDEIELAPNNNYDSNLPTRGRNYEDIAAVKSKPAAVPNGGIALSSRFAPARSPANFGATAGADLSFLPTVPAAPSSAPIASLGFSGGISPQKLAFSATSNGTSRCGIAHAPVSGSPTLRSSNATSMNVEVATLPSIPDSIRGTPTQITGLGKPKPSGTRATKPAPAEEEEDIFASMGLSANPTFSHAPSPPSTRPGKVATAGRWSQQAASTFAVGSTTTIARAAATTTLPTAVLSSQNSLRTTLASPSQVSTNIAASSFDASGGDDNAEWGDDADLDDLLND